jgi:hypothetical protein
MPPQGQYAPPPPGYYPPPPPVYYPPPPPPRKARLSNKPKMVGTLLIIVGVLGLVTAGMGFFGLAIFGEVADWYPGEEGDTMTVAGRVTMLNGTAIGGAVIVVVDEGLSAVTDSDGYYAIYNVPVGDQTLSCSKEGYTTINRRVTVSADIFRGDEPFSDFGRDVDFAMTVGDDEVTTGKWIDGDAFDFKAIWLTCTVIILIASLFALFGAFNAFKRANISWVIVGCVAGIFTVGFVIGSILAFVALFILLISLEEFKEIKEEKKAVA